MIDESSAIDERRLVFPGLAALYRRLAPLGYLFTRVAFAVVILYSGWEKVFDGGVQRIAAGNVAKAGFSPPLAWAWAVGAWSSSASSCSSWGCSRARSRSRSRSRWR